MFFEKQRVIHIARTIGGADKEAAQYLAKRVVALDRSSRQLAREIAWGQFPNPRAMIKAYRNSRRDYNSGRDLLNRIKTAVAADPTVTTRIMHEQKAPIWRRGDSIR